MIKAIIIDDEIHSLEALSLLLAAHCPQVSLQAQCRSAQDGLEAVEKYTPDLVFLDIEMPVMNGFEMLEQYSAIPFAVIFTTSYNQYAIKAFRFNALDYLLKPIDEKELAMAVKKVADRHPLPVMEQFQELLKQMNGINTGFNKIAIPTDDGFELVPADQVIYCEANANYTHFLLKNKRKIVACRILKEIEAQVQALPFFARVHHSYLVNLNEVTRYVRGEGGYLIMSDGSSVAVSRSRKDALLNRF